MGRVDSGAGKEVVMSIGETPGQLLRRVIEEGRVGDARELLWSGGVDVNAPVEPHAHEPLSPLMVALRAGDPRMVELVLSHPGLDLARSLPRYDRWRWAATASLEVLRLFASHPAADLGQQDGGGTALLHEVAAGPGGLEKLSYLLGRSGTIADPVKNDGTTPLYHAALHGNADAAAALLRQPVDVNNRNRDNRWTVLMVAAAGGHEAVARLLLRHPEIDPNARSDSGDTALHIAAERGHGSIAALLLEHPAIDVNRKNAAGWTALHKAAFGNHLDVVRALCARRDLDPNRVDRDRQTALHWAVLAGHAGAVRVLLECPGVNAAITSRPAGQTALQLAESLGRDDLSGLLREAGRDDADVLSADDDYTERKPEPAPPAPARPFIADPPIR